jgi:hypothetical protein
MVAQRADTNMPASHTPPWPATVLSVQNSALAPPFLDVRHDFSVSAFCVLEFLRFGASVFRAAKRSPGVL